MNSVVLRDAVVVNEGRTFQADIVVRSGIIDRVAAEGVGAVAGVRDLDVKGRTLLHGVNDEQVHFCGPGLTHKEDIAHASAAAAAGGITSYMEMPNTLPNTLTQALLEDKYKRAAGSSSVNYSFYMGVANENLDDVLRTDPCTVSGSKAFLGSSTGNMLVDEPTTLESLFRIAHMLHKMSHALARLFNIEGRGFIREGYHADLVLVDRDAPWTVTVDSLLTKCAWSPFTGQCFGARVLNTWVNGGLVYEHGRVQHGIRGQRLLFER